MMTQEASNLKEGLKQLTIIHMALTFGVVLLFTVFWFLFGSEPEKKGSGR